MPVVSIFKSLYFKSILLLLLVTWAATASAKVYLVSVGVSDYPGWNNDLRLPHNNAATMKWLYDENKNAETILLMNSQATVSNVMNAMSRLFSKATENDIVTLFISGHGVPGGFMCFDGCLNYSYIKQIMSRCRSKNKMIFRNPIRMKKKQRLLNMLMKRRLLKQLNLSKAQCRRILIQQGIHLHYHSR